MEPLGIFRRRSIWKSVFRSSCKRSKRVGSCKINGHEKSKNRRNEKSTCQ
jgi:hypothetical protein